jgi:hypothetical protein
MWSFYITPTRAERARARIASRPRALRLGQIAREYQCCNYDRGTEPYEDAHLQVTEHLFTP